MRPTVTRAEFAQLTCNRCGDCCERFTLRSPLDIITSGWLEQLSDGARRFIAGGRTATTDRTSASTNTGTARDIEHLLWLAELEPLPEAEQRFEGRSYLLAGGDRVTLYRCPRFVRDGDAGHCSIYETRPLVCHDFPHNFPHGRGPDEVMLFERCSFNVDITESDGTPKRIEDGQPCA